MIRRFPRLRLRLVIGTLGLVSAGCEPHHSWLRHQDKAERPGQASEMNAVESDTSKILGVDSDEKKPKPFFQSGRRSGGLSSEAREIEKDLGVD